MPVGLKHYLPECRRNAVTSKRSAKHGGRSAEKGLYTNSPSVRFLCDIGGARRHTTKGEKLYPILNPDTGKESLFSATNAKEAKRDARRYAIGLRNMAVGIAPIMSRLPLSSLLAARQERRRMKRNKQKFLTSETYREGLHVRKLQQIDSVEELELRVEKLLNFRTSSRYSDRVYLPRKNAILYALSNLQRQGLVPYGIETGL